MFSFKHVHSRLHFAFTIFVEIFSSSRTDFRRSAGKFKIRDPKETTDIANNTDNTNDFEFIFLPTFQLTLLTIVKDIIFIHFCCNEN